jgi:hypothetical protein
LVGWLPIYSSLWLLRGAIRKYAIAVADVLAYGKLVIRRHILRYLCLYCQRMILNKTYTFQAILE